MKIQDIDKVNHLIGELNGMKELIAHAERADPADCELFIKLPGDSSIRLSSEGAASTHYQGFSASAEFLRGCSAWRWRSSMRGDVASSRNWRHSAWRRGHDTDELVRRS